MEVAQAEKKEDVLIPSDVSTPSTGPDTANAGKTPVSPIHAEALKFKTAEKFITSMSKIKGIKKYSFDNNDSFDELIDAIDSTQTEKGVFSLGLRGIYKQELGKKYPRNSFEWTDETGEITRESIVGESKKGRELSGTSVIYAIPDWDSVSRKEAIESFKKAYDMASNYGDGEVAIVMGNPNINEVWGDDYAGEAVFTNPVVIGYVSNEYLPSSELTAIWNEAHGTNL